MGRCHRDVKYPVPPRPTTAQSCRWLLSASQASKSTVSFPSHKSRAWGEACGPPEPNENARRLGGVRLTAGHAQFEQASRSALRAAKEEAVELPEAPAHATHEYLSRKLPEQTAPVLPAANDPRGFMASRGWASEPSARMQR